MATPHGAQAGLPVCARHRDRPTGLSCTRCGRPACPECLVDASVGYQCVDCVEQGRRTTRQATTVAGARTDGKVVLVPILIAVNVAVFLLTAVLAQSVTENGDSPFFRALVGFDPSITDGQPWRLLTAGFLHFGPFHVLVNMMSLWFLRDTELVLGRARFLALYLLALLGGSVAEYVFGDIGGQLAGASGAVYGVLGALVVLVIRLRRGQATQLIVYVLALTLITWWVIPNVSLLGHLGGLVVGAALAVAFVYAPPANRLALHIGACALVVVALASLYVLRQGQLAELVFCTDPTAMICYITR
ncbi:MULTISPECIES: rhomboid family intramembrane serine protease [Actinokineospora]|uniref:Rhomboid family protein n=1 Tax=Actinokineospora fastidiosa TaxID=1816 RepID=A0A918L7W1_9PSEU|nr:MULTISPECIES: rhomboid family intramembrane serine protease [Actinokineospora]UVS76346.1 Rhomboid protease GluP [Actinokineospora sp. UTMC 2448]GGS18882.1 rhomboid family protein [Actinokineospora fastidiosa]